MESGLTAPMVSTAKGMKVLVNSELEHLETFPSVNVASYSESFKNSAKRSAKRWVAYHMRSSFCSLWKPLGSSLLGLSTESAALVIGSLTTIGQTSPPFVSSFRLTTVCILIVKLRWLTQSYIQTIDLVLRLNLIQITLRFDFTFREFWMKTFKQIVVLERWACSVSLSVWPYITFGIMLLSNRVWTSSWQKWGGAGAKPPTLWWTDRPT